MSQARDQQESRGRWIVVSLLARDHERGERLAWLAPMSPENNALCQSAIKKVRRQRNERYRGAGKLSNWRFEDEVLPRILTELGAEEVKLCSYGFDAVETALEVIGGALLEIEGALGPLRETLTKEDFADMISPSSARALLALAESARLESVARKPGASLVKRGSL